MPLPSYVVELSFGASSFIDVTQYVKNLSINRGISSLLEDYSAGSVSITFVNNSRIFDPINTSSPLWYGVGGYSLVQPGGSVRVSSNGVRRFTGRVQSWDFSFDESGLDGQATVTALDSLYDLGLRNFTASGRPLLVESTGDRVQTTMSSRNAGTAQVLQSGNTVLGFDVNNVGDNVLSYLQNVARSEPADFYANVAGTVVYEDRSFTDYNWLDTNRQNRVLYPGTATVIGTATTGWNLGFEAATAIAPIYGGTVVRAGTAIDPFVPADSFVGFDYKDVTPSYYQNTAPVTYVFSGFVRGFVGQITGTFYLTDDVGSPIASSVQLSAVSAATANWTQCSGTVTTSGTVGGVQLVIGLTTASYASTTLHGQGFIIERASAYTDYFDGGWNTALGNAVTRYEVAWADVSYASMSGQVKSSASTATNAVRTFADVNSQGALYGNGTAIQFMDLGIVYGSEQLYNQVQVGGVNATATVTDATSQSRYSTRVYSQTDNLTTSVTRPAQIASALLPEYAYPEYRADSVTFALESLTSAEQNILLGVEIRDVVRVCFQPSGQGAIVDKLYTVLGVSCNTDVERDSLTFSLASLDNMPPRLSSNVIPFILDTDTLA